MRKIDLNSERELENRKTLNPNTRSKQDGFYKVVNSEIKDHYDRVFMLIKGKSILEIGCSTGKMAESYYNICSSYVGCNISDLAILKAKQKNLAKTKFICCDAHELPFKNSEFDVVVVSSLLHHLDLETILSEISRVLRKDGFLVFREPLGINPIFNLYRFLTPNVRTDDEKPFTLKDIFLIKSRFRLRNENSYYFGFLTLINSFIQVDSVHYFLRKIDLYLSKTVLKYLFWQWSSIVQKK